MHKNFLHPNKLVLQFYFFNKLFEVPSYSLKSYNNIVVNDGPYIQQWSHKEVIGYTI